MTGITFCIKLFLSGLIGAFCFPLLALITSEYKQVSAICEVLMFASIVTVIGTGIGLIWLN